jgi:hypothetical protein
MAGLGRRSVYVMRWRKRVGIAVAVVAIAGAGFAVSMLQRGASSTDGIQAVEIARSGTARNDLMWCKSRKARRLDLNVGNISCRQALDVVAGFSGHVAISYPAGVRGYLFPDHGWTCWAKPEFKGHGGGVQNFCMHNGSGIVYFQRFDQAKRSGEEQNGDRGTATNAAPSHGAAAPGPAAIASGDREDLISVSAAQSKAGFEILMPGSLPDGYEASGAWVPLDASQVRVHFAGADGDIVLLEKSSSAGPREPNGLEFPTSVNGYPALGVRGDIPPDPTGPVSQLQWWTGRMYFDLYGPVPYEEIERTAGSVP